MHNSLENIPNENKIEMTYRSKEKVFNSTQNNIFSKLYEEVKLSLFRIKFSSRKDRHSLEMVLKETRLNKRDNAHLAPILR